MEIVIRRTIWSAVFALWSGLAFADPTSICIGAVASTKSPPSADALLEAVQLGNATAVEVLLKTGANPNARATGDPSLRTIFAIAAARSDGTEMARLMWQYGASPFIPDRAGRRPIDGAHATTKTLLAGWEAALLPVSLATIERWREEALAGDMQALCTAFDRHRRFSLPTSPEAGLLSAVVTQQVERPVLHLLSRGAVEIDAPGPFGTMLQLAIAADRLQAITALLHGSASVEEPDRFGRRPLMMAAAGGRSDIARVLIAAGANPRARSELQGTPLIAATFGGHAETMAVLLRGGASANVSRDNGETALAIAVTGGHAAAMQVLLDNSADPNGRDARGRPAAVIAAQRGAFDLVSDLLAAKADPMRAAPDGQSLLELLQAHNNRSLDAPASIVTSDVAALPSDQDQVLAPPPQGPNLVDPVYPSELDVDGNGGIGPPVTQYLNQLAQQVRAEEHRALRAHFGAAPPADATEQRLKAIADQQRQSLINRASLRQQRDVLLADQARFSQTVLDLQAQISELDQARAAKRQDIMTRVSALQLLLNQFLRARQEALTITEDLEALHNDFVLGNDARFDRLAEARRNAKTIQAEIDEERDIYVAIRQDLRKRHDDNLRDLRGEVDEREQRLREETAELARARSTLDKARANLAQARNALRLHLNGCGVQDENLNVPQCHTPGCVFMQVRDRATTRVTDAQTKVDAIAGRISETRALLADELRLFRIQRRSFDDQLTRDLQELKRQERNILRDLRRDFADAQTLIARHTADFEARRALLEERAKEREAHIAALYGPDHDRLYRAMVTFVSGWRGGEIVAEEALWGYGALQKIREDMDAAGINAPAFAEMYNVVSELDIVWQIFGTDHLAQLALSVALSDAQSKLQAATNGLAGFTTDLEMLDRLLDALELERDTLLSEGDSAAPPDLDAALRLSNERIAVTKELLSEAFDAAAVRTLSAADLAEGAWGAALQQMTGTPWPNPLLNALESLPQAAANGTILTDPGPDVLSFTPLDAAATEGLIAAWLPKIDFDATEWATAVPAQSVSALRGVFFAAMAQGARFDRAQFKDSSSPPAYRLTTPNGSYWIRADGSMLSFLDTDIAPMFEYSFTVPAGTAQGDLLRAAYAEFVSGMKNGFEALPPERKRLAAVIEAALRSFDQKKYERLVVAAGDGLKDTIWFILSAAPAGQFITIGSIVYGYATSDDVGLLETTFTVALERWGWNSLSKFRPLKLRAFFPNSEEASVEVVKILIKDSLFHQDKLISGLGLQDAARQAEVQRHAETLRVLVTQASDFVEADNPAPPTSQARWSSGAPVIEAQLTSPVVLTTLHNAEREIYVTGTVTPQRQQRLAQCLGLDLKVALRPTSVTGSVVMGVARGDGEACMIVTKP